MVGVSLSFCENIWSCFIAGATPGFVVIIKNGLPSGPESWFVVFFNLQKKKNSCHIFIG